MMRVRDGAVDVFCDEQRCPQVLTFLAGVGDLRAVAAAARDFDWRVYADPRRRDLCPAHRQAAQERLTPVR